MTYILNITILQPSSEAILRFIHNLIANKPICKTINNIPVTITWKSYEEDPACYYAEVEMFTDIVVSKHLRQLRHDILKAINNEFGPTKLDFFISKLLSSGVIRIDDE